MTRKSKGTFEGSELSRGHGDDKFRPRTARQTEEILQTAPETREETRESVVAFIKNDRLWKDYYKDNMNAIDPVSITQLPPQIDYAQLANEQKPQQFPEYSIDMFDDEEDRHYEKRQLQVYELGPYQNDHLYKIFASLKHLWEENPFPNILYLCWLQDNPDKVPKELRRPGHWFYVPGSLVRGPEGDWHAISGRWNKTTQKLELGISNESILTQQWMMNNSMILFERGTL